MRTHTVLGIGELLWDCFGDARKPGGAPANVAFHAAQLGDQALISSRVGRDEAGDELLDALCKRGLSTAAIQRDAAHATGRVTVDTARKDRPAYTIPEDAAWDHIEWDDSLRRAAAQASAICFGTLAQRSPVSRASIKRALDVAERALLVYDVNLRPPWYDRVIIESSLRRCHVAKLNEDEAVALASLLDLGTEGVAGFAAALRKRFGVEVVCVTRADKGCVAFSSGAHVDVPACQCEVVDAVGAGDAFSAALIHGLLAQRPLGDAVGFANQVGALVASHQGAMPALREEFGRTISAWAKGSPAV